MEAQGNSTSAELPVKRAKGWPKGKPRGRPFSKDNPPPTVAKAAAKVLTKAEVKCMTYEDEGAPAQHPEFGDKTPAFMSWVKQHHPEHYAIRYGERVKPHSQDLDPVEQLPFGDRPAHVNPNISHKVK